MCRPSGDQLGYETASELVVSLVRPVPSRLITKMPVGPLLGKYWNASLWPPGENAGYCASVMSTFLSEPSAAIVPMNGRPVDLRPASKAMSPFEPGEVATAAGGGINSVSVAMMNARKRVRLIAGRPVRVNISLSSLKADESSPVRHAEAMGRWPADVLLSPNMEEPRWLGQQPGLSLDGDGPGSGWRLLPPNARPYCSRPRATLRGYPHASSLPGGRIPSSAWLQTLLWRRASDGALRLRIGRALVRKHSERIAAAQIDNASGEAIAVFGTPPEQTCGSSQDLTSAEIRSQDLK